MLSGCVYNPFEEKWAEIVPQAPASILEGKVYIALTNKREFDAFREYRKSKDLRYCRSKYEDWSESIIYALHDSKLHLSVTDPVKYDDADRIVPFPDFAQEVGITVPKFILKSEDGVDLYEGDKYWSVWLNDNIWPINNEFNMDHGKCPVTHPDETKAFSTLEAAEAWIAEKNKAKDRIVIDLFNNDMAAYVYSGETLIKDGDRTVLTIHPSDLEAMAAAYHIISKPVNNSR